MKILLFSRSDTNPNPVDIANFEEIFEARGARKCWVPGRLTSPLALHYAFPANYERYCLTKTKVDRNLMLNSGYMQGTILTCPPKRSVSMNWRNSAKFLKLLLLLPESLCILYRDIKFFTIKLIRMKEKMTQVRLLLSNCCCSIYD